MTVSAFDEQVLRSTLKKFRIGGAIIAALPLPFSGVALVMGRSAGDAAPFTIMSVCLLLLVLLTVHCLEGLLKRLKSPSGAG